MSFHQIFPNSSVKPDYILQFLFTSSERNPYPPTLSLNIWFWLPTKKDSKNLFQFSLRKQKKTRADACVCLNNHTYFMKICDHANLGAKKNKNHFSFYFCVNTAIQLTLIQWAYDRLTIFLSIFHILFFFCLQYKHHITWNINKWYHLF